MNEQNKEYLRLILKKNFVWFFIKNTVGRISNLYVFLSNARGRRNPLPTERLREYAAVTFKDKVVLNGPFKGLKYAQIASHGSSVYSKLLGSYEKELQPSISALVGRDYSSIVDIGCAEGFYAVGLGRMFPDAKVYGYDTHVRAKELCSRNAALNDVDIELGEFCTAEVLLGLDLGQRSLIFSDCEGYELELITKETVNQLNRHDFVIESHVIFEIETTRRLLAAFKDTHDCELIVSKGDCMKVYDYDYVELEGLSMQEKWHILKEERSDNMHWVIAKSRI